jgi:uncharacterized membrane protein
MGSTAALVIFVLLAAVELIADQLPSTPSRTKPPGLIARIVLGGLSGAGVTVSGEQSIALGAVLGAVGGVAGAFGGYEVRTRLVKAMKVPDLVIALLEDAVAIGGGLLIVCRGSKRAPRRIIRDAEGAPEGMISALLSAISWEHCHRKTSLLDSISRLFGTPGKFN